MPRFERRASRPLVCPATLVAATVSVAALVNPANAAVIYSQVGPSAPIGAFTSNDMPGWQKIADNFLLSTSEPMTIRSIRFIGGYVNSVPPPETPPLNALPTDDFRVLFFSDAAGAPGVPLVAGDFQIGLPVLRTSTGGPVLNGVYFPLEYFIDLGTGITVNAGTPYWISILNDLGPSYGWAWARTAGVFDQQVAVTDGDIMSGPWEVSNSGGMFFELSDNSVPEPTTLLIILTATLVSCWLRFARTTKIRRGFGQ